MKTSNIILLAFFLLVFIIPYLVTVALSNKIRKGQYSRIVNIQEKRHRKLATGQYHTLNIKSSSEELFCQVINDGSSYIEYDKFYNDSIGYRLAGDTLTVFNLPVDTSDDREINYFHITIHTNNPAKIRAERANIQLFYVDPRNEKLNIALADHASLTLSSAPGWNDREHDYDAIEEPDSTVSREKLPVMKFKQLEIVANSSSVYLANNVSVDALTVQADNESTIRFFEDFSFGQVDAQIEDGADVKGPWKTIRNLKIFNR